MILILHNHASQAAVTGLMFMDTFIGWIVAKNFATIQPHGYRLAEKVN
ncbi:hypothetical protein OH720_16230 [Pseudomonas sp. WJP1]|nr:hypothetical protein [Pseudomonas sp. WJP1]WCM48581.1 hypothetical protein OH720_16230 [Pseudomonas sp. WJP1]